MGVLDNTKFILSVCEMYYKQGLSQKEISAILKISRPQISRIIATANERNLITVRFNYPNAEEFDFQEAIKEKYGIESVIYDLEEFRDEYKLINFARMCSDYLSIMIKDGDRVGVMASRTIRAVAEQMPAGKYRGLQFIPLTGGFTGSGNDWYANSVAQCFASKMNGRSFVFNAPQLVVNPDAKNILLDEPTIKQVVDMIPTCDISLVGIGNLEAFSTGVIATGLNAKDVEELKSINAVASVCSNFIDSEGNLLETRLSERVLGTELKDIVKSKRIAIAYGDDKTEAIRSVLRGKHIDVLMTSLDTAKKIIE